MNRTPARIVLRSGPAPVLFARDATAHRLPWFRERRPRSVARGRLTLAAVLLAIVGLYTLVGISPVGAGGASSASAIPGFSPCDWLGQMVSAEEPPPATGTFNFGSGSTSATPSTDAAQKFGDIPGYQPTAPEWFGYDLAWKAYPMESMGSECGASSIMNSAGTMVADTFFKITAGAWPVGQAVISWAISADAFTPFVDAMTTAMKSLTEGLFLEYLAPVVLLATIWIAWQGLVKKRSRESFQGMIWTIAAGALSYAFLMAPKPFITGTNDVVQGLTSGIIKTMASAGGEGASMCSASGDDAEARQTNCALWKTFVYTPWAAGQFGDYGQTGREVSNGPGVSIPGHGNQREIGLTFLDVMTVNHDSEIELSHDVSQESRNQLRTEQWQAFVQEMNCGADDYNSAAAKSCPARGSAQPAFTGDGFGHKLQIALLALVAFALGAIPLIFLTFTMVVFQITFVFLMITAPIFLLLGIHPGFGRKIAMGWLEMVLANCLKRIATAVLVGILLIVLQAAIASTAMSWLGQVFLMAAASIGILMYRKKFLDKVSDVKLGGDGGDLAQGSNASGTAKRYGKQAVTRTAGAVGGGVGSANEGAGMMGIIGGSAMGAMMGRGTSPIAAARMGNQRGSASAARKQNEREAEVRSQEEAQPEFQGKQRATKLRAEENTVDDIASTWGVDKAGSQANWAAVIEKHRQAGTKVAQAVGKHADEMNRMAADLGVQTRERTERPRPGPARPPRDTAGETGSRSGSDA